MLRSFRRRRFVADQSSLDLRKARTDLTAPWLRAAGDASNRVKCDVEFEEVSDSPRTTSRSTSRVDG